MYAWTVTNASSAAAVPQGPVVVRTLPLSVAEGPHLSGRAAAIDPWTIVPARYPIRLGDTRVTVDDAGEFGLIAHVTARLSGSPLVLLGPGDDAAVVAAPDGRV